MRILIVEDDAALSSFIQKGLEAEHHTVDVANEGNQGRSMAMEVDYDLVVLDLNLPGVDGLSILKSLLRRSHLPSESVLTVRDLCLDRVERKVERAGRHIELTAKEFALLEYLMRN